MAVHGTWEHPLLAAQGRLDDRRVWRSGRLPRSAAGPSYLPFAVGGADSHLPLETAQITLRTCTPPILRHIGFRFSHMDRAVLALAATLRSGPVPLAGAVFPGSEPSSWRRVATDEPEGRSGGTIYLTFAEPDGFPGGGDSVTAALREAGGELFDDSEVLAWWEDHWAQAAREGSRGLAATGILRPDAEIGSCRVAVSWKQALLLLRSIESLTGGATSAIGWIEAPREAGCSIEWRFTSKRKGAEAPALVGYQLRATLRAHGARIEAFDFDIEPDLPAYTVTGRGTSPDPRASEVSNAARLTAGIREHLEASL
jgi:hypothetical protein